jgi:large subunit ribosomal protein L24
VRISSGEKMLRKRIHIKRNDLVMVTTGKEKGKTGKVLKVIPKKNRVVVEKVNFIKRHQRPTGQLRQGGIIEKEGPIHVSNVSIMCGKCNQPVRIGRKILENGKTVRMCKKCGEVLDI